MLRRRRDLMRTRAGGRWGRDGGVNIASAVLTEFRACSGMFLATVRTRAPTQEAAAARAHQRSGAVLRRTSRTDRTGCHDHKNVSPIALCPFGARLTHPPGTSPEGCCLKVSEPVYFGKALRRTGGAG